MEQMTTHVGIEPGHGLVGQFGDTVILIPRGEGAVGPDEAARELLGLAAVVASDRQVPPSTIAARLAAWVIGRLAGDALAFGIVVPVRDGVVMFLRGAVWCTVTEGGSTRELSGEQALTWVDQMMPARSSGWRSASRPASRCGLTRYQDLRDGVVPGQGFVLTRTASASGPEPAVSAPESASGPEPAMPEPAPEPEFASEAASGSGGFAWSRPSDTDRQEPSSSRPPVPRSEEEGHQPTMLVQTGSHAEAPARTARPGAGRTSRPSRSTPRRWCRRPVPRCRPLVRRWRRSRHWAC